MEQAAPGLGWEILEQRETPDFIVREGSRSFGLELTEVFNGTTGKKGAKLKEGESVRQKTIDTYRRRYEERGGSPLSVQILGDPCEENLNQFMDCLQRHDLEAVPRGKRSSFQVNKLFRARVARAFRSHWQSVDDTVGWVNQSALPIIQKSVDSKARRLEEYRDAIGSDVRLLVVANHLHRSGMLSVEEGATIDCCGFHTVYFFPYPEAVQTLCQGT